MDRKKLLVILAVVAVVGLATFFRIYDITNYPPGLFPDEAANGEDALLIMEGDYRPFYPRGNGRESLFFYLEAISISLFGVGVWQLHLVAALIGVLTVLATYFATRVWFGRLAGILAAGFLATNHWHVTMSRTGFRAILIPLFLALFTAWVGYTIQAVREKRISTSMVYAALAGAAFTAGFYTYIAYRVMIGVVVGVMQLLLMAAIHPAVGWPQLRRYWRQIIVGSLVGLVVFAPLIIFFLRNPEAVVGRAGQVSIFNAELQQQVGGGELLGTLAYSTRETLTAFFIGEGDVNWRHSVAGFPLLNPLVGLLALLGLAWTIRGTGMVLLKIWRGQPIHLGMIYPYMLLMIVGMLVPVVTTAQGIPHGLRSIGLVFPIFFLAGAAGSAVLYWLKRRVNSVGLATIISGVVLGLLALGVLYDGSLYFLISRNNAQAHYFYRADLTQVARYIDQQAAAGASVSGDSAPGKPYLVLGKFSIQTVHFLTTVMAHEYTTEDEVHPDVADHSWRQVDPGTSHFIQLAPGEVIIFTQSTMPDADRYVVHHPDVELIESQENRFGEEILRAYRAAGTVQGDIDGNDNALDA